MPGHQLEVMGHHVRCLGHPIIRTPCQTWQLLDTEPAGVQASYQS